MKTIKCAKCEKDVLVSDDYQLKTCPICLEKRKANYAVESAERDFERDAEKKLRELFGDNIPEQLKYGKMKEFYEIHFHRELTWEQYLRAIHEAKIHRIQSEADDKVRDIKGEKAKRIKYNAKFLDFEMFPPSNRNECKKFRHMAMGSFMQDAQFLEMHVLECPECRLWKEALDNGVLNAECSCEIWHPTESEQPTEPISFEEWENQQGQDVPREVVDKALSAEYHLDDQTNTMNQNIRDFNEEVKRRNQQQTQKEIE